MSAISAQRKQVTITTDGACLGNDQNETRAAAAAILEYQEHKRAIACYIGASTNQRAEIIAAVRARVFEGVMHCDSPQRLSLRSRDNDRNIQATNQPGLLATPSRGGNTTRNHLAISDKLVQIER